MLYDLIFGIEQRIVTAIVVSVLVVIAAAVSFVVDAVGHALHIMYLQTHSNQISLFVTMGIVVLMIVVFIRIVKKRAE